MRGCGKDRGQVLPIVALELWIVAGMALLVVLLGERAVDRARAQAGADAVALAAAADPSAGSAIAELNGVNIDSFRPGLTVDVVVSSGTASAAARAESNRPGWEGLDPRLVDGLRQAESLLGEPVVVVSGLRSRAEQARLWADRHNNPYPVAPPGTSLHEAGLAVDVPLHVASRLATVARRSGLCQPLPLTDPVHFTLC